jgi:hypothetical protein
VLAALVRRLGYRPGTALIMGGVYGLATLAMPYARTLFGEPTVALALLATLYGLWRSTGTRSVEWALAAGAALGLAICARAINAPLIALFALYLWLSSRDRRLLAIFLTTSLVCGLGGYAWYNTYRFGSPVATGYQFSLGENFSTPPWIGFYGLLFSPFRGLFWFSPILLAAPFGIGRSWARHRWETLVALCLSGFYILLFSAWWMWWGGFAWGPRFLLPVVPFILLLTAPLWELPRARWVLWGLALISLSVQILAVSADFSLTETVLENTFGHPERSAAMVDPRWSPILLQARHLAQGFWDIAWKTIGVGAWPVVAGSLFGIILALIGLLAHRRLRPAVVSACLLIAGLVVVGLSYGMGLSLVSRYNSEQPFDQNVVKADRVIAEQAAPDDVLVTLAPFDYASVMNWADTPLSTVGLAPHPAPLRPQEEHFLADALERPRGLTWLLAARIPPGSLDAAAEHWLAENGFLAYQQWFGDLRLLAYGPASNPVRNLDLAAQFDGGIWLDQVVFYDWPALSGQPLRLETRWRATGPVAANYTLFLHLLDHNGQLVAGLDGVPVNGYRPTTTWQPDEIISDRRALLLPAGLAPGQYTVEIGLYDGGTGQRLPVHVNGETQDKVSITAVPVE